MEEQHGKAGWPGSCFFVIITLNSGVAHMTRSDVPRSKPECNLQSSACLALLFTFFQRPPEAETCAQEELCGNMTKHAISHLSHGTVLDGHQVLQPPVGTEHRVELGL